MHKESSAARTKQMCISARTPTSTGQKSTQAWFEATVRTDVTDGLRTRWQLAERDPELAVLMLRVYGRNEWLYSDTQSWQVPAACAEVRTQKLTGCRAADCAAAVRYGQRRERAASGAVI